MAARTTPEGNEMTRIAGMNRLEDTIHRTECDGDNWHSTWADDGTVYTSLCDGRGWPGMAGWDGPGYNTRVYTIGGEPPAVRFGRLAGYPDAPMAMNRYYGFGILAVGETVYEFLSTPNHRFSEPGARFAGAKLIHSPDRGATWLNQDGSPARFEEWEERTRGNMVFFEEPGDCFSLNTILQMGQGYAENRDGYVYVYAPNGSTEGKMNELVMFRAPVNGILDRAGYEFFVGVRDGGSADWSPDIADRGPVHTFPSGWVNTKIHPYAWHPSVVYNAPLDAYMMLNWGMGCDAEGMWFGKPSYLGMWIASTPWGPWTQVYEDARWTPGGDMQARCYQPQIIPNWIAADGLSFWMVWTDFQVIDGAMPYYSFNYQKVELRTG